MNEEVYSTMSEIKTPTQEDQKVETNLWQIVEQVKQLPILEQLELVKIILNSWCRHLSETATNSTTEPTKSPPTTDDLADIPGWGAAAEFWPEDDLAEFEAFLEESRSY